MTTPPDDEPQIQPPFPSQQPAPPQPQARKPWIPIVIVAVVTVFVVALGIGAVLAFNHDGVNEHQHGSLTNAPQDPDAVDAIYLDTLDDDGLLVAGSEDDAIDMAHAICDAFDSGMSDVQVISIAVNETNWTGYQAGSVIGAAVASYCPEHLDDIGQ